LAWTWAKPGEWKLKMKPAEMMETLGKIAPAAAEYLAKTARPARDPGALVALLAQVPSAANAYFERYSRALEHFRNALVPAPILWTWISLALAFLAEAQGPASGSSNLLETWEKGWITPVATVMGTACLVGAVFLMSMAVPVLDTVARRKLNRFMTAFEREVLGSLTDAMTAEQLRWQELRVAFADGPERIRVASDSLVQALDHESHSLAQLGEARSAEIRDVEAISRTLKEVVSRLSAAVTELEVFGKREDAALSLIHISEPTRPY